VLTMDRTKYAARIANIYFLGRIGESLRWATEDIARKDLPANIKHLLARLDRLEARERAKQRNSEPTLPDVFNCFRRGRPLVRF